MNFSEALTVAKAKPHTRIARKLWSSYEFFKEIEHLPGRYITYVKLIDVTTLGVPPTRMEFLEPPVGPLVRVVVRLPGITFFTFEPHLDDMIATDWDIVEDAEIEKVLRSLTGEKS